MLKKLFTFTTILFANMAYAHPLNGCLNTFVDGKPPVIVKPTKINSDNTQICFSSFAVNYSNHAKVPNWSAEYVTPQQLAMARRISRKDNFHEESRIAPKQRSLLADYKRSGYDRGHLSPNGNRYNRVDQYESFSLSNIVPQSPVGNQNQWREIEEAVRTIVTKTRQPVYIITGTLFLDKKPRTIGKSKVYVPSHLYKAVYFPNTQVASAYVIVNDDNARKDVVPIAQLQSYTQTLLFPSLMRSLVVARKYDLPYSANAAYKQKNINISTSGASNIFSIMPSANALPSEDIKEKIKEKVVKFELPKLNKSTIKKELESLGNVF